MANFSRLLRVSRHQLGGFTPWITLPLVFIIRRSADFSLDSSFILSFRITTTIHSIVQFVIICSKRLSVASQLLLRRHLCLPADVIRRIIDKYAGPSANLEGFTLSLYLLVRFCKVFSLWWAEQHCSCTFKVLAWIHEGVCP